MEHKTLKKREISKFITHCEREMMGALKKCKPVIEGNMHHGKAEYEFAVSMNVFFVDFMRNALAEYVGDKPRRSNVLRKLSSMLEK